MVQVQTHRGVCRLHVCMWKFVRTEKISRRVELQKGGNVPPSLLHKSPWLHRHKSIFINRCPASPSTSFYYWENDHKPVQPVRVYNYQTMPSPVSVPSLLLVSNLSFCLPPVIPPSPLHSCGHLCWQPLHGFRAGWVSKRGVNRVWDS